MVKSLREAFKAGKGVINAWSNLPSAYLVEVMGRSEVDTLTLDLQHGLHDAASLQACLKAIPEDVYPLVRVPWNTPADIMRALDAGAKGIICPMVNSAEDAARLAGVCRYPPLGERSWGPWRANLTRTSGPGYRDRINEDVFCLPMVETALAITNIEEIVGTEGVDGVYVGPADLGLSYGLLPKLDREEPEMLEVLERIVAVCRKHGKMAGIHCGEPAYARRMLSAGFSLVSISTDTRLFADAVSAAFSASREGASGPAYAMPY